LRRGRTNSEFGRGGELNTIIGKGTTVLGDAQVQNSLRIDGKIKGNIRATDTVVVGKEGEVEGRIQTKHLLLAGKVNGNIAASGKVFLESTASVFGDIQALKLVIDEGAYFDGKCSMKKEKEETQEERKGNKLPS